MEEFDVGTCKGCGNIRILHVPFLVSNGDRPTLCKDCDTGYIRKKKFEKHLKMFDEKYGKGVSNNG
jgi:hypothetical protein